MNITEAIAQSGPDLNPFLYREMVEMALKEDLGRGGDITSEAMIDPEKKSKARLVLREAGIVAGLPAALRAFELLDPNIEVKLHLYDGQRGESGQTLAELEGSARALLTAERTALNLLGHLSGIATLTRLFVDLVSHTRAEITDTRKTLPLYRALQKYAVRCGGAKNHRLGLDDAVMLKDNHVALAGSFAAAVERIKSRIGHTVKIEVEVDTLVQLKEVLHLPVDIVLLDNMSLEELTKAVELNQGKKILEASGGVNESTVEKIAETGVHIISVGALTHSVNNLDVALDMIGPLL